MRFQRHFTRDEANALLADIRHWLARIELLRARMQRDEQNVRSLMRSGEDVGGASVNEQVRALAELQALLAEFTSRGIVIKDMDRGLIDFPSLMGDREVFLCWTNGEAAVEYWHDLDAGFAGREPL
jgi:hypothetical protein